MKFTPSSEDDIAAHELWAAGIYPFVVLDADETVSSKNNPMIEVKLEITRRDGARRTMRDWLLPQRPAKLLHACQACGVEDKYNAGYVDADDFVGKKGKLKLGIKRATKDWPRKNVVVDYVV